MESETSTHRHLGIIGATGVGVGAIVGGGILALAGVAFSTTGPAAMVAFAINGLIAMLTALSFAEMASKFPESGGTYTFSKKVLSVEAAFIVGWVVWFASIVAAVLYAIGFGYFARVIVIDIWNATAGDAPEWLEHSGTVVVIAIVSTTLLTINLIRSSAGGGQWANIGKVVVFGVLIVAGAWAISRQSLGDTATSLRPFFASGLNGLIQAMGYTFIALQGFDLIAAVGGEVRNPAKTLPRAMILSLLIALGIYIPLLFVITTVGVSPDDSITEAARQDPEGIVAIAAGRFMGPVGYWLVTVAAVLSMFTALQANLFAASRIAFAMARDRTLPSPMSALSSRNTPVPALLVTGAIVASIIAMISDVGAAGAAASLIFLVTFALAHWISILVRQRSVGSPPPFCTPLFPMVPIIGGLACIALAVFQGVAVPSAGAIVLGWMAIGVVLYLTLFARRAKVRDAASTAFQPELVTLRGKAPLVLVPIANPRNAEAMIELAGALVPAAIGRVLMQTVVVAPPGWNAIEDLSPIDRSHEVMRELLRASLKVGIRVEALTTVASEPMTDIARVARLHQCGSVLVGLSHIPEEGDKSHMESLLADIDADVVALRARDDWTLHGAKRILVPVAGRGGHESLLARLLGSITRSSAREVTFLRILGPDARPDEIARTKRELNRLSGDLIRGISHVEVVQSESAVEAVAELADSFDLIIIGAHREGRHKEVFGDFTRGLAHSTRVPLIVMSKRG